MIFQQNGPDTAVHDAAVFVPVGGGGEGAGHVPPRPVPDHSPPGRGLVRLELSVVVVPAGATGIVVLAAVHVAALIVARGVETVRRGGRQLAPRVRGRGRGEPVQIPVVKVGGGGAGNSPTMDATRGHCNETITLPTSKFQPKLNICERQNYHRIDHSPPPSSSPPPKTTWISPHRSRDVRLCSATS